MAEERQEPVFPWNDMIDMTTNTEARAICLCLSAVFDAIQALRGDLRDLTATVEGTY